MRGSTVGQPAPGGGIVGAALFVFARKVSQPGLNRRVAAFLAAVAFSFGCERKPSPAEEAVEVEPVVEELAVLELAAPEPASPESTATEPDTPRSIDDKIAEALKHVDPIVIYERVPIPDEENAFPLWLKAIESLPDIEFEGYEGNVRPVLKDYDGPFPSGDKARPIAEWLAQHGEALEFVDAGVKRGRCLFPPVSGLDTELPYLIPLRHLGRVRLLKSKQLASAGRPTAAAKEMASIVRMAEMIEAGEGCLICWLVGLSVHGMSLSGARWLARQEAAPEAGLLVLIRALKPCPDPGIGLAVAYQIEFTSCFLPAAKDVAQKIARGRSPVDAVFSLEGRDLRSRDPVGSLLANLACGGMRAFDVQETLDTGADYYAKMIGGARAQWRQRDRGIGQDLEAFGSDMMAQLWQANFAGKALIALLVPGLGAAVERSFRTRTDRAATRALLALRLYELRHGALPSDLQALVEAGILPSIPIDPFSDEPLRYSRQRRLVWSVGPNETDEGGRVSPEDEPGSWSGDDFVLRVPAAN